MSSDKPPLCILAGGLGTRLGTIAASVPKAVVALDDRPFLEFQLELARLAGVRDVVVCVGHLGNVIEETIGEGTRFGLRIRYSYDGPAPIGTGAALRQALPLLGGEFLVTYGDTLLDVDFLDVAASRRRASLPALMTVIRTRVGLGSSNALVEGDLVRAYCKSPVPPGAQWMDYGLLALTHDVLRTETAPDLADSLTALARRAELAAYPVERRFYEIGTPESLEETEKHVRHSPRFARLRRERGRLAR